MLLYNYLEHLEFVCSFSKLTGLHKFILNIWVFIYEDFQF